MCGNKNKRSIFTRGDHDNGMRLRLLTTNKCNLDCSYCLNDFQRDNDPLFLDSVRAAEAIESYADYCNKRNIDKVVTFSGGETGLWNSLYKMCQLGSDLGCQVKVCTNGAAFDIGLSEVVDRWHLHIFSSNFIIPSYIDGNDVVLQYVVTDETTIEQLFEIIKSSDGYSMKFFVDYYSSNKRSLSELLEEAFSAFPERKLYARYTGIQTNRGMVCHGCNKECVTLKGIWVFPSGEVSTCPQGVESGVHVGSNDKLDYAFFDKCYNGHKIR